MQTQQCLMERLWPICEDSQIIDVAKAHPHSWEVFEPVVEAIQVEVGQELAGEIADGQAPGALQRSE